MERNKQLLAACLAEIEGSLGWGSASDWSNDDFENVSDKIFDKTGTRLSLSTLRRIWGRVRYDGFPNSATLNALAAFAGYADWRDFCSRQANKKEVADSDENASQKTETATTLPQKRRVPEIRKWLVVIMLAAAVIVLAYRYNHMPKVDHHANYVFSARKVTDDLPNSVIFTYGVPTASGAKVMIQQSWDTTRREYVDPNGTKHTSIYYYPGYFRAKLMMNGEIVRETPVYIQTKGWKGIAQRTDLPVYFNNQEIWQNNTLTVSAKQVAKALGVDQFNDQWIQFANIHAFPGIDGDKFVFETTLRNTAAVEECLCRKVRIMILGVNYPIMLPLAAKGCVADIDVFAGDSAIMGKEHDLSAFGCDFSIPQRLKCEVKNRQVNIYLNNNLILTAPHTKPMGAVVGVRILFEGPGEVTTMKLANYSGASYDLMKQE